MLGLLSIMGLIDVFTLGLAIFSPVSLTQFTCITIVIKLIIELALIWRNV